MVRQNNFPRIFSLSKSIVIINTDLQTFRIIVNCNGNFFLYEHLYNYTKTEKKSSDVY